METSLGESAPSTTKSEPTIAAKPEDIIDDPKAILESFSAKPDYASKSRFKTAPKSTVKISGLLNVDTKKDSSTEEGEPKIIADNQFTAEQLRSAWMEFAELRKVYQAEYQLLSQEYQVREKQIVVQLMNPFQDTMLNNIKSELTTFLREKLQNNFITLTGEVSLTEDKKVIYTSREKFEYLAAKNPILNELKDRLSLDTDL